jgi:hypothetical protein
MASEKRRAAKRRQWIKEVGLEPYFSGLSADELLAITQLYPLDGGWVMVLDYERTRVGYPSSYLLRSIIVEEDNGQEFYPDIRFKQYEAIEVTSNRYPYGNMDIYTFLYWLRSVIVKDRNVG